MFANDRLDEKIVIDDSVVLGIKRFFLFVGFFVLLVCTALGSFYTVQPGQTAVLVTLGSPADQLSSEGFHFKMPLISSVRYFSLSSNVSSVNASAASSDLQSVSAKLAVNWAVKPSVVLSVYRQYGDLAGVQDRLLYPAVQEAFKATTAGYTAEQLITQRQKVSSESMQRITTLVGTGLVNINAFSVLDFDFSPDFNQSIEKKVKAEQDALTEKNKLETVKYQAQQAQAQAEGVANATLINAKAEAEAIKIKSQAITSQGGADYVELKRIEKWDGKLPETMYGGVVPMINVSAPSK